MIFDDDEFDIAAYITSASGLQDLEIDPAYLRGVQQFMKLAHEMSRTLDRVPLEANDAALGPVFRLPESD